MAALSVLKRQVHEKHPVVSLHSIQRLSVWDPGLRTHDSQQVRVGPRGHLFEARKDSFIVGGPERPTLSARLAADRLNGDDVQDKSVEVIKVGLAQWLGEGNDCPGRPAGGHAECHPPGPLSVGREATAEVRYHELLARVC